MPDSSPELPAEAAEFLARHPETVALDAFLADLSGVVRGSRKLSPSSVAVRPLLMPAARK